MTHEAQEDRVALAVAVGQMLRKRRQELGMSTRDVADQLGVAPQHVTGIETTNRSGRYDRSISVWTLYKPAAALNATLIIKLEPNE